MGITWAGQHFLKPEDAQASLPGDNASVGLGQGQVPMFSEALSGLSSAAGVRTTALGSRFC